MEPQIINDQNVAPLQSIRRAPGNWYPTRFAARRLWNQMGSPQGGLWQHLAKLGQNQARQQPLQNTRPYQAPTPQQPAPQATTQPDQTQNPQKQYF